MSALPAGYDDPALLRRVKGLMNLSFGLLGFGYGDMRLAAGNHPELDPYNGQYLSEIAKARGLGQFENYIDIAKKSGSTARLLIDKYSSPDLVATLMRHPASHFMTDAWIEPSGLQNPAALGCFPRFLERAREGVMPLEAVVRKMTGANADRAQLKGRGYLKAGGFADLVVLRPGVGEGPLVRGQGARGHPSECGSMGVRAVDKGLRVPLTKSGHGLESRLALRPPSVSLLSSLA